MDNPYMKFYVNDFLQSDDVIFMSLEEVGLYIKLLCLMWQHGGELDSDENYLAKLCGLNLRTFRKVFRNISHVFEYSETCENSGKSQGKITQKRLKKEYEIMTEIAKKRSQSGKKRRVPTAKTEANAKQMLSYTDSDTDTDTDTDINNKNNNVRSQELTTQTAANANVKKPQRAQRTDAAYTKEFEAFWTWYPLKKDKRAAYKAWQARVKAGILPEHYIRAAKNYAAEQCGTDAKYIKHASTFISAIDPRCEYTGTDPRGQPRAGGADRAIGQVDARSRDYMDKLYTQYKDKGRI